MPDKLVRTLVLEPDEAEALERFASDVSAPISVEDVIIGLAMMQIGGEGQYVSDRYVNRLTRQRDSLIK
jgi:hypothetical protein